MAANSEVSSVLRKFAVKVTSSGLNERRQVLDEVAICLTTTDLPDNALKTVINLLTQSFHRYKDSASNQRVHKILRCLLSKKEEIIIKSCLAALGDFADSQKKIPPSQGVGGAPYVALQWTCVLVQSAFQEAGKQNGSNWKKLVEAQASLVSAVLRCKRRSLHAAGYQKLKKQWKQNPTSLEGTLETLSQLDPSPDQLSLAGLGFCFADECKSEGTISKYKKSFLGAYMKVAFGGKVQAPCHVLEYARHILKHIDHEEFRDQLVPAVQKALLRSPENVLEAVGTMISGVTLDLSQYAVNLGKSLATHLHAKDERLRDLASQASSNLAKQCSDSGAVEELAKLYFAVLSGSEGKITVPAEKMGLLSGIGGLHQNGVMGSSTAQALATAVIEPFIAYLQQEVHEGTLVNALDMLRCWCSKFSTQVPKSLLDWFSKVGGQKQTTTAVRNAYCLCMCASFKGDTLGQGVGLKPFLKQSVERAQQQVNQVAAVTEGLSAMYCLVQMAHIDVQTEEKLSFIWSVLDAEKQIFTSQKFLSQVTPEALNTFVSLSEKLLMENFERLKPRVRRVYCHGLMAALVHQSWKLQKHAQQTVKKLLTSHDYQDISVMLMEEFRLTLSAQKISQDVDAKSGEDQANCVPPKILVETLKALCPTQSKDDSSKEYMFKIVLEHLLLDAHHPRIYERRPSLWQDLTASLVPDFKEMTTSEIDRILNILQDNGNSESAKNAITTLAKLCPDQIIPAIFQRLEVTLDNPRLSVVTRREISIMLTPEGELFDTSVIDNVKEASSESIGSLKRESKAYSFKEQLEEIELRKELEKKKGKKQEKKLTKKQEEAKQQQLEKEAEIRTSLQKIYNDLSVIVDLFKSCIEANPDGSRVHIPDIIPSLLALISSPLACDLVMQAYACIGSCIFPSEKRPLGELISHCTFRVLNPDVPDDPSWKDMELKDMALRTVHHIFNGTVPTSSVRKVEENDEDSLSKKRSKRYSAPSVAFFFPMLRKLMMHGGILIHEDDDDFMRMLQVIQEHTTLRTPPEEEELQEDIDENGPVLLPRADMMELLTNLIGVCGVQIQQTAMKALIDLCTSAGGGAGCAVAEKDEIRILLQALQSPVCQVREAALKGLQELLLVLPTPDSDLEYGLMITQRLLVAKHDPEEKIKAIANELWTDGDFENDPALLMMLIEDVVHHEEIIRECGSRALATLLEEFPDQVGIIMQCLFDDYAKKKEVPPPVLDSLGRIISEAPPDDYAVRCGIASALACISPLMESDKVPGLFEFLVPGALGDRNGEVRKCMLDAGQAAITAHGKANVSTLLPVFEKFLDEAPDIQSLDAVRQSVIILMGSLAKHLDKDDPKVKPIVGKLIEALSTPSQQVQEAVANCLPPLVPAIKDDAPLIVTQLINLLLNSEKFGERKGAAYGLAGVVKGLGILSLKKLEIMDQLLEAIQDKKNFRRREGALFAFEMLCSMLGRLFEPYVVNVLPHLLLCFGDGNQYVREATDDTARAVMSKLSGHGVKLVLPSLLAALEEDSWRTKAGSVELLGAMAFCAPKQLSSCLPSIVPKLTEVLTDSHVKVQKAGAQALKQIGSVIRNPEIQAIVPTLLEALSNPSKRTSKCLQVLLETKFVHFIDAPSLALIMPVVQRAFQDRSTETRKMAAQIIGNMYSLTDQKDLQPYLPSVIPGLKTALLDPVPEVRRVSAKALGAMVKGMGEASFEDLTPWLMEKLISEQNSVDRSGAAQGLSEVIAGMGIEKLEELLPDIIRTAEAPDIPPHVRDGYMMMFIYLPGTFGDLLTPYVGKVISPILLALADESEYVRDTALRAGHRIVNMYAETAVTVFLPELEKGLFDDNWRIRFSSIQLLGDLLYKISGVTGKMTTVGDEDDNFGTEQSTRAIITVLGKKRRNRVLAGLYMGRSDTALMVRQAALHVWKVVVVNTPRTLKEILSTLFTLLLGCLASTSYDKRQVAARTLGDLVRKLGDRVLPEIIPILEKGLDSVESDQRQGVCVGLSEIMNSTSREQVLVYVDSVVPTVRKALCDPLPEVREAAARTFENLHNTIGHKSLEDILPVLLEQLDDPEHGDYALDGLKNVMMVKNKVVLPYLVPKLIEPPVNTKVLSILSEVAGESLTRHLTKILPALMSALNASVGSETEAKELEYCQIVVLSVKDPMGLQTIIDELLPALKDKNPGMRQAAATILNVYCSRTKVDYSQHVSQLLRAVIMSFTDAEQPVLEAACDALASITKSLDDASRLQHISSLRQAIRYAASEMRGKELPGFCIAKKGVGPILPIFREGVLNGPPDLKEQAAIGLGEVINLTSKDALKPQVVNITGPLIRVLGDRYVWNVKVAILQTLTKLLAKVGVHLKAFLPQLQTTFLKALSDTNRMVRLEAASALSQLVVIHTRVDPLFTELLNGIKKQETETSVRETMLQALRGVIAGAGQKMSDATKKSLLATLPPLLSNDEDAVRLSAAGCLGALTPFLSGDELDSHVSGLVANDSNWLVQHSRSNALAVALKDAASQVLDQREEKVKEAVLKSCTSDKVPVCTAGIRALGFLLKHCIRNGDPVPQTYITSFIKGLNHMSNDIKKAAAQMIYHICQEMDDPLPQPVINSLVVVLVSNTKDKNTAVQAESEFALVSLLRLKGGSQVVDATLESLDAIPSANLAEIMKRLNKVASQAIPKIQIDDTMLLS